MICQWLLPSDSAMLLRLLTWLVFPREGQSLMPLSFLVSFVSNRSIEDGLFLPTTGLEAYRARAELGSMSLESELHKKPLPTSLHVFQSKDCCSQQTPIP